jgi:hypothetical protein
MMIDSIQYIGKFLIVLGISVAFIGALLMISVKISFLGKLPGDILIQKKNFTFYFPIATSIIVSLVLTLLFWLFGRR